MLPQNEVTQQIVDIKVIVDAIISSLPPADKKEYDALDKKTTDTTGLNAMVDFFNDEENTYRFLLLLSKESRES